MSSPYPVVEVTPAGCTHERLPDGTVRCRNGMHRDAAPGSGPRGVDDLVRRLRRTVGTLVSPAPLDRRALGEIADRVATAARGARFQAWGATLGQLAAELDGHAAPADLVVLRRLRDRFTTLGARLVGS